MITMRGTFIRRKITKLFESRKEHLDYRIKRDFVRKGIATILCQISEYYLEPFFAHLRVTEVVT